MKTAEGTQSVTALAPKRRWFPRLRFSLRTLLLLVLTAASGATLWWNWGPWEIAFVVKEPGSITQIMFSDDDQYVMFSYGTRGDSMHGWTQSIDIRRADTGAPFALIHGPEEDYIFELKGNYLLTLSTFLDPGPIKKPLAALFNWTDGKQLKQFSNDPFLINGKRNEFRQSGVTLSRTYVANWTHGKCSAFWLPELKFVTEWPDVDEAKFLENSRLILCHHDGSITIHNLDTGKGVAAQCTGKLIPDYKPIDRFVSIAVSQTPNPSSCLLDTETGQVTRTIAGTIYSHSADGRLAIVQNKVTDQADVYDLPSGKKVKSFSWVFVNFSPDGKKVIEEANGHVSDTSDFKLLYSTDNAKEFSVNGKFVTGSDFIGDAQNGRLLMSMRSKLASMLSTTQGPIRTLTYKNLWSNHSSDFAVLTYSESRPVGALNWSRTDDWKRATVWHLRRPYRWYGPAYLPEFWLTVLFGARLIWSIFRDRRNA